MSMLFGCFMKIAQILLQIQTQFIFMKHATCRLQVLASVIHAHLLNYKILCKFGIFSR